MRYTGESNKQTLLDFFLFATFSLYYDAKMMIPSLSRFFYLNSYRQLKGGDSKALCFIFFLSLLFLKNNQFKIIKILKDKFVVNKLCFPFSFSPAFETLNKKFHTTEAKLGDCFIFH